MNSTNRANNVPVSNGTASASSSDAANAEDQLNRINLQALQNRDPYITKIVDQAQRVCVFKFVAEKREWERKELEGTLFVYERICAPYHGFSILNIVSRDSFVQIIKPSMEFKHTPAYEAFLQFKVDVGDIYGIWFISKNDCPRVTECLKQLTVQAKDFEQSKAQADAQAAFDQKSKDILLLLSHAQEKFQESKRKQEPSEIENSPPMPAILARLFSTQDPSSPSTLKNVALSVVELEKKFLQPSPSNDATNNDHFPTPVPIVTQPVTPQTSVASQSSYSYEKTEAMPTRTARLMTPADFQTSRVHQSPVLVAPIPIEPSASLDHFSKEHLRHLLVDMLQNDEEFVTGLYSAYSEKQNILHVVNYSLKL